MINDITKHYTDLKEEFGWVVEDGHENTKKTFYGMKPIAKSDMNFCAWLGDHTDA